MMQGFVCLAPGADGLRYHVGNLLCGGRLRGNWAAKTGVGSWLRCVPTYNMGTYYQRRVRRAYEVGVFGNGKARNWSGGILQ